MNQRASVVIPCFDPRIDELRRALTSVRHSLGQVSGLDSEIWVIDDGSSNASAISALVADVGQGLSIHLHRFESNRGVAAARNEGFSRASGEFIFFVDADDEVAAGYFSAMLAELKQGCDVVVSSMRIKAAQGSRTLPASAPGARALLMDNTMGAGIGIRRKSPVIEQIWATGALYNLANRFHYEDWELNLLFSFLGARFGIVAEPLYIYHLNDSGRNSRRPDQLLRSSLDVGWNALRRLDAIDPTRTREAALLTVEMLGERVMRDFSAPPPAPPRPWWKRIVGL